MLRLSRGQQPRQGVAKRQKSGAEKFVELTLHRPIEEFAAREQTIGPPLMALKWLGNAGGHITGVRPEELLDAFEIWNTLLGRSWRKDLHTSQRWQRS
jgi:hypothetical protein